ncbi:MAG: Wzz/FepE/Etk N-terminal domain-containing protein [Ruminiclostridium sp.]
MNENQQNAQYNENEIDLRELFMALWKRKIMIISFALIGAILAGLFSMFMISPVYDTKLNIVISMPETYISKYGEYKLPITTNEQYIDLITSNDVLVNTMKDMGYKAGKITLENLRDRISIGKITSQVDIVQNSFEVTVSADDSKEAKKLAETVFDNYIEFSAVMINERAISFYYDNFSVDLKSKEVLLKSTKEILKKNQEILADTPQTIDQKAAMSQLPNTQDYVVLENIINPNYTEVEKNIIENKQLINTTEDTMRVDNENLKELDKEKIAVEKYYATGKTTKLQSSLVGVVETSIYLPSPPVEPSRKTSPSNTKNAAIGLVLGGMLGVMIALIREYWLKKA